ncbi:MAG: hypothetical protein LQ352_005471 [Teloschistes flavicans]|nr:MAG: hypothetical protein LQ352_005471 [Teloschistes flavicans]
MSTASPELAAPNPVKAGDKFPEGVKFTYVPYTSDKEAITSCGIPQQYDASKEFADKKTVLFAVPGFIENLSEIKAKGVDLVVVIAFNDAWVMSAWSKANNIKDEILFMTDADTKFSKSIGWTKGERTGRYAMVIDHGKITYAENEPGGDVTHKTLDVITLFHKASSPASIRAHTLLKQISAHASETATEDQAADHTAQNKLQRTEFELNVTEDPPTSDQLRTILEYLGSGGGRAGQIVEGATDESDALKKLKEDPSRFKQPVIVDWNNGRAGKLLRLSSSLRAQLIVVKFLEIENPK